MNYYNIPQTPCGLTIEDALTRSTQLSKFLKSDEKKIDLGNTRALLLYNRLILQEFLGLDFSIPEGFLIPAVCSRWKFLDWSIKDILKFKSFYPQKIIEIGTGASCILALILAKIGFLVHATEINEEAYISARANIEKNNLSSKIILNKVDNKIIEGVFSSLNDFDALISNPPQYNIEYFQQRKEKKKGFLGKKSELVGGKKGHEFIIHLIQEIKNFDTNPPIYFQLTLPSLEESVNNFLNDSKFAYISKTFQIGNRKRIFYRVK